MFERAYEMAEQFTRPVVIPQRTYDGKVFSGVGSFIILNQDGWIVTAGHIFQLLRMRPISLQIIAAYEARMAEIDAEFIDENDKQTLRDAETLPGDHRTHVSYWWGADGVKAVDVTQYPAADIAVCRLEGLDTSGISTYPVFGRPQDVRAGRSLVKIGYPFTEVPVTFDPATERFTKPPMDFQRFPIEGIQTRIIDNGVQDGLPAKLLESSSPGLLGQSGGPWLDMTGVVWAVQSATQFRSLGFSPEIADGNGQKVQEHQFLNVGVGIHPETLQAVFSRHNIDVQWAGTDV